MRSDTPRLTYADGHTDAPPLAEPAYPLPREKRQCNRHDDCDAADERARTQGPKDYYGRPVYFRAEHCHDECCEECFGY